MENYTRVRNKIDNEGISYFLMHYTDEDSMPDEEGKKLFKKARIALEKFEEYVEHQAELEDQNEN